MGSFDKIILSCNEDPTYMSFWKPVATAYKKMFPDVEVHLAFLTYRAEDDPLVKEFREYGEVTLFKPTAGVQQFAQSKLIRYVLASEMGYDVCYIDDIDLFPLSKKFITDKTDQRPEFKLLCVGGEVYHNNGCYPVSQMTFEGWMWKKFINPKDYDWPNLIEYYERLDPVTVFDRRENVNIPMDFANDNYFSDERLLRRLIHDNPVPVFELHRGYEADKILEVTLDRMDWQVNIEKLNNGEYFNAHGLRPYDVEEYQPLVDYVNSTY